MFKVLSDLMRYVTRNNPFESFYLVVTSLLFQSALQRLRAVEESIESERAAHLETKFNSEIVQVNVTYLLVLIEAKCFL